MITICTVCRGNLHRSPVAAAALRRELDAGLFRVLSAGLAAVPGQPSPSELVAAAAEHGLDLHDHRATPLESAGQADLYVTMTRQQARQMLVDHAWSKGRVVPYGELPMLLQREVRDGDVLGTVARRSSQLLLGKGNHDIADPKHDSLKVHRPLVAELIRTAELISARWPVPR